MAEIKRRTLFLNTGKRIKLFGSSIALSRSMEMGEAYRPNIFSCEEPLMDDITNAEPAKSADKPIDEKKGKQIKNVSSVLNPYQLTREEMWEIADFNIRLWMDFKDLIREFGVDNPKIFNGESVK